MRGGVERENFRRRVRGGVERELERDVVRWSGEGVLGSECECMR